MAVFFSKIVVLFSVGTIFYYLTKTFDNFVARIIKICLWVAALNMFFNSEVYEKFCYVMNLLMKLIEHCIKLIEFIVPGI
ncbi:hypothetical protein Dred_2627 [Desulforamulus reducens MI-1]|uniref:Uncharacterized protein n=1 Tax=Desulforamulus reducens (strain ATCC BAA-1160 / DSM 100696 / MI-1) TaxID=349161 RepID=A4J7T4_DESRM|nr:hypothetical protein [Desulforamulus reducens]ABO51137.1 hypothetical protein Dred_2627 [Desulforamulus reducens MI-1]